ncbi:MAG: hypothetical protein ABIP97_10630 [Chthoniobacterales bacterium]
MHLQFFINCGRKFLLGSLLAFALPMMLLAQAVPAPNEAMSFALMDDSRPWQEAYTNGTKDGCIMEFVIKGDNVEQWKELVAQQIIFTNMPLKDYIVAWKAAMKKSDPNIEMKQEVSTATSALITYKSLAASEQGVRRFIQGTDGIYSLAYTVRPNLAKPATLALWKKIALGATLVPNPEKR